MFKNPIKSEYKGRCKRFGWKPSRKGYKLFKKQIQQGIKDPITVGAW